EPTDACGHGGCGRNDDNRRWIRMQDADRAAERAATAAHRAGDRPRHGGLMARNRRDPLLLELLDWRPEAGVLSVYVSVDPADRSRSWRIALREQLGAIVGDAAGDASRRALEAACERVLDRFPEDEPLTGRGHVGFVEVASHPREIWR